MAKEYLMVDGKLVLADGDLVQVPDTEQLNDIADENGAYATQTQALTDDIEDLIVNGVIDGSPRGVYDSLSALQTAYPSGASGVYLTTDNGYWNYWNGTEWKAGTVYQTSGIADGSITPEKTSFMNTYKYNENMLYCENGTYTRDTFTGSVVVNDNTFAVNLTNNIGYSAVVKIPIDKCIVDFNKIGNYQIKIYVESITSADDNGGVYLNEVDTMTNIMNTGISFNTTVIKNITTPTKCQLCILVPNGMTVNYVMKIRLSYIGDKSREYVFNYIKPKKYIVPTDIDNAIENGIYLDTQTINAIKNKFRYLVPTFVDSVKDGLILLGTNDLKTFDLVAKRGLYTVTKSSANGLENTLRDPAIIKIEDYYYIVYTVCAFSQSDEIGMCRTKDFKNFEELDNLVCVNSEGASTYYSAWAPNWIRYGRFIYITVTCQTFNSDRTGGSGYFPTNIYKYNVDLHTLEFVRRIELSNRIDAHFYHLGEYWYALAGGYHLFKSQHLANLFVDATFTEISNDVNLSISGGYEANEMVVMDDGRIRLFAQQLKASLGTEHYTYTTSSGGIEGSYKTPANIILTNKARNYINSISSTTTDYFHFTIYDFKNGNNNNNHFTD